MPLRCNKSLKLKPTVGETKKIFLDEAVGHIKNTCSRGNAHNPFFFMVGAGISHPPVPLSDQIIKECKKQAAGRHDEQRELSPMEQYSRWLERAFHSPEDRARYFRDLIEDKFVPPANLRLAHLLSVRRVSNIVATTNFDDFIARALMMFGERHIVCDHPATASRIDPENDELQILHVHGSYRFYDCRNLAGEIEDRAERSAATTDTMADCLDRLLSRRSPLVVGYSGWEKDVFMKAFRRRLASGLRYSVYWFCYRSAEIESLPPELKEHPNVFFVVPTPSQTKASDAQEGGSSADQAQLFGLNMTQKLGESGASAEATLPATDVFEALAGALELDDLPLIKDPLRFFADQLRASVPTTDDSSRDDGIYSMSRVIRRVLLAADKLDEITEAAEKQLEEVLAAVRTSRFRLAVEAAERMPLNDLDSEQTRRLIDQLGYAVKHLSNDRDNSELVVRGSEITERAGAYLIKGPSANTADHTLVAKTALAAGRALVTLEKWAEATKAFDELAVRFGDAEEAPLREQVANALVNKGFTLGQMGRAEESLTAYEEVLTRFGDTEEASLRETVAGALNNKGVALGQLGRANESLAAFEEVVARFGHADEARLGEVVARALVSKGFTLGQLGRANESLVASEEVVARFGDAEEAILRALVARALGNKGAALGQLGRVNESLAASEDVVARFGDAEESIFREAVARALGIKGLALGQMERAKESLAAYDEVVTRFGDAEEASLREAVARALRTKGLALGQMGRTNESLAACEEVVTRFGDAEEASLREEVAGALNNRACSLLFDAKRLWNDGEDSRALELLRMAEQAARDSCDRGGPQLANSLGTHGYILFLLGQKDRAREIFTSAIALGGESIREGGLKDSDTHSLPQDEEFREWIRSIDAGAE